MRPPTSERSGGTRECPDDRNREGCRCDTIGATAPCWPGRRVNRDRGICRDGTTTCTRAGNADSPSAGDCVLARVCTGEVWYPERGVVMELPPLPSWTSTASACARQFSDSGGYGEMSVLGLSIECDPVDDGSGGEYVFNRVNYCPIRCNTMPDLPECMACMMGGSGMF